MAVDQLHPPRPGKRPDGATLVKYEQYIDTQIGRTRSMTKAVDIASALIVLAAGAMAFLLAVALAEHWLVPGGFGTLGRFVLFAILVFWAGYVVYRRLMPLILRPINPVYAAQTIEKSSPTLKNSLLNLLLFRRHRSDIPEAVYQTLEEQAAERLVRVPVESAVDRAHLIRLGYVLLTVFTLGALYTIFSPKDPLTAARRVLMPWADVPPASRVSILDVQPGSASVARGEVVEVSAEVRGITDDDAVLLRYTTDDRQAVGKAIPMTLTASGRKFVGRLPEDSRPGGRPGTQQQLPLPGARGIADDLRYWIEAGDARSREYLITVLTAPTIVVQRIDYEYPSYTGFVNRHVEGLGDIRAIEGTQVTIHAKANGPIAEAYLDFEADGRRDDTMKNDGADAQATFMLALRDDRYTPQHTNYVVRFTNSVGRTNRDPVQYPIEVMPDYRPEIEILAPQEKVRDVRLNETVTIEVEARDPDFALGQVRLQGEVAGRSVFDVPLLAEEHRGRFTGRFQLTPSQHDLRAGDTVHYWARASDNRTPEANVATTAIQTLRISSPDPNRQPPPGERQQRGRDAQRGERGEDKQPSRDEQQAADDGQPGDRGEEQNQDQPGGAGGEQGTERQGGDSQQRGERGKPNGRSGESDERAENNDTGENGSAAAERQPESGGTRPDAQSRPGAGSRAGDKRQGAEPSEDQSPVSPDGDNDGEAFERIGQFLRKRGQLNDQEQDGRRPPESGEGPGAETTPGETDRQREQPAESTDESDSPGGQQTGSKGPSGAGDQPGEDQGAPDSEPGMKPADKWQQRPSDEPQTNDQEPPSTGKGKRESDSQGEQGGDMAGGGQEGGGQDAPREGTGSAGQNQSADEGMGESSERGAGHDSPNAGQDSTAPDRTGQSGDQSPGQGTQRREGQGKQPGGEQSTRDGQHGENGANEQSGSDAQRGEPRAEDQSDNDTQRGADDQSDRDQEARSDRRSEPGSEMGGTATGGGGLPGAAAGEPQPGAGEAPEADAAKLEYTREQTDLVLEKLADQLRRRRVDKELLDQLGWTEEELRRFVERWQQLKTAARSNEPSAAEARRELDDALRSLGLRPRSLQQTELKPDEFRDLREGYRGPVPLEYQERLRAYNESISRARQDNE